MALKDIPANLGGYKLMITEAPTMKMKEDKNGVQEQVVDRRTGEGHYLVSLFAKKRPQEGEFAQRGEEIKVTLTQNPGEGFEEGTYVELLSATVSHWERRSEEGRFSSGLSYKAIGMKPLV
ncbi:hypothetical protein ACWEV3_10375 [Saccharopolyspora sp. NPDC003752]